MAYLTLGLIGYHLHFEHSVSTSMDFNGTGVVICHCRGFGVRRTRLLAPFLRHLWKHAARGSPTHPKSVDIV